MTPARARTSRAIAPSATGLEELLRASAETQAGAYAASTRRKYRRAFERFQGWCFTRSVKPLPAAGDVVAAYLEDLAQSFAMNSVKLHLAAISKAHELCKLESPRFLAPVRAWLRGAHRKPRPPVKKARPLTPLELWKCIDAIAPHPAAPRDTALLLVGFATGAREAELVALDVEDLERVGKDWLLRIRASKTDPTRAGITAGVPQLPGSACCPATALEEYLAWSGITSGALFRGAFRSGRLRSTRLHVSSVDDIIQRAAVRAQLPTEGLSGHSLRRGIATAASQAGCTLQEVASALRHRSLTTALGYVGDHQVLAGHVLRKVGLG